MEWNVQLDISEKRTKTDGSPFTIYNEMYYYSHFVKLNGSATQQTTGSYSSINNCIPAEGEEPNTRIYTDDLGDAWVYTLNSSHTLAEKATYLNGSQVRTYQFGYTSNEQLASVTEHIDGELFSTIRFDYIDNASATMSITMHGFTDVANIRYASPVKWNAFPNYFLLEVHPLGIHRVAFYDGLFGINHRVIESIQYEGSDEKATFEYNADMPATCIVPDYCTRTIQGNGYNQTRKVSYTLKTLDTK